VRPATIALALDTALDITAARRLHDYGELDDANVQRALEQSYIQRVGRIDWPAHLRVIRHVGVVVEQGDAVRVAAIAADGNEAFALSRLFAQWPDRPGAVVAWQADTVALIAARAFLHDIGMPAGLRDGPRIALADDLDTTSTASAAPAHDTESELARLLDGRDMDTGDDPTRRVQAMAINRYRWWLRWQHCQARIDDSERVRRETALQAAETAGDVSA